MAGGRQPSVQEPVSLKVPVKDVKLKAFWELDQSALLKR